MRLRVIDVNFFLTNCRTRIPFRFGISTMTQAPLCVAEVKVESENGEVSVGLSSDLLVPKWFEKNPDTTLEQDIQLLLDSAQSAAATAQELPHDTVFSLWHKLHEIQVESKSRNSLADGFGVALMERAIIDATCRMKQVSFAQALQDNLFDFDAGSVHAELEGLKPSDWLPKTPRSQVQVRHTVGLVDPLRTEEIPDSERIQDGLPQSLEEDIHAYGLECFKIKLCGERQADLVRLSEFCSVVQDHVRGTPRFTVDANEQFQDLGELVALFSDFSSTEFGPSFVSGLVAIEQPLPRTMTFDAGRNRELARVSEFAPVLIDEADANINSFRDAVGLGYQGVSMKNCKGVFQAILNHGLCQKFGDPCFQSAEDLTNLPVVALQQDLTTVSILGLPHVERNGHHYFRGLNHLPKREAEEAAQAHSDLYHQTEWGYALNIKGGMLDIGSLHHPGYGYDTKIHLSEWTPLSAWSIETNQS